MSGNNDRPMIRDAGGACPAKLSTAMRVASESGAGLAARARTAGARPASGRGIARVPAGVAILRFRPSISHVFGGPVIARECLAALELTDPLVEGARRRLLEGGRLSQEEGVRL